MGESLWRTTRDQMFAVIKKTIANARRKERAAADLNTRSNERVTSERWRPSIGVEYWYITDTGVVEHNRWEAGHFDTDRWEIGNVFCTKAEAEQAREKLAEVLRRFHTTQESETRMSTPS